MSIPAGYLHENKKSAGIAGIKPNPNAPEEIFMKRTLTGIGCTGAIPAIPA
jgi:hypothetical protein